ncbi:hypothetical protein AeRB84_003359 [Aphanomyces euteiches]|nr:hypothetical protein AeRB84_003359 [Aphanomyces euteiches]
MLPMLKTSLLIMKAIRLVHLYEGVSFGCDYNIECDVPLMEKLIEVIEGMHGRATWIAPPRLKEIVDQLESRDLDVEVVNGYFEDIMWTIEDYRHTQAEVMTNILRALGLPLDVNVIGGLTKRVLKPHLPFGGQVRWVCKYHSQRFDGYFKAYASKGEISRNVLTSDKYSVQSAIELIRQALDLTNSMGSEIAEAAHVVLKMSLEIQIHRELVLALGLITARVVRHVYSGPSDSGRALLCLFTDIGNYFKTKLLSVQLWKIQQNITEWHPEIESIASYIDHLHDRLFQCTMHFHFNMKIQVVGRVKEDLKHDFAKIMYNLENIDKRVEMLLEIPRHRQMDAFYDQLIQLQRGFEFYNCQVALGNIHLSTDYEIDVTLSKSQICRVIDRISHTSGGLQLGTIQPWMLSSDDVQFDPNDQSMVLGRGGFATVFKGRYYGQAVAVKRFDQIFSTDSVGLEKMIAKEINGWKNISHQPYVLTLVGICTKTPTPILVSELCQTNIRRYIRDRPDMLLPLVYQFACGLACIHKANIIHRDLKGDNVLITYQDTVAIADFGLSRTITSLENTNTTVKRAGTLNWMSPEQYFLPRSVTAKSDVWSIGMTLWEILCDDTPFRDCSEHEVREEIYQSENDRPEKPEEMDPVLEPLWTLMARCWRLKPEARPSSDEIVEFLKNEFATQLEGL